MEFPNCIGAIDGKHVMIQCPFNSGSSFYNYKSYFSIVLLAVGLADYRLVMVDVGTYGSISDSGVLNHTTFFKHIRNKNLNVPPLGNFLNDTEETHVPNVLLGDGAFPLRCDLMRPFARNALTNERHIFNYRLSRGRRVVENAFGILAYHWRIYHHHIYLNPNNVTTVVKATVVLHNILMLQNDKVHTDVMDNRDEIFDDALQSKEINLQLLPVMSETTLLTTSIVIVVLLNGRMIAHKIEFKIMSHYIKLNHSRSVSLQCIWSAGQPADQKSTKNCLSSVR